MIDLRQHLTAELKLVDAEVDSVFDNGTAYIKEIGLHINRHPGKRLRPCLLLLTAKSAGYSGDSHIKAAAAVELIHTASLIHDDIVDEASIRRGQPTVNQKWGNNIALLIADYLYSKAFSLLSDALDSEAIQILCEATAKMSQAELLQVKCNEAGISYDDYYLIIKNKTAVFFAACVALGSIIAGASDTVIVSLSNFGLNFGMAFQITDDLLDIIADEDIVGKDIGNDFSGGKQTLAILRTREMASEEDGKLIDSYSGSTDIKSLRALIDKYDGIEYTKKIAKEYSEKAIKAIEKVDSNAEMKYLKQLAQDVVAREF